MFPISKKISILLLLLFMIFSQYLLFYSSSYWVSWNVVIGDEVRAVRESAAITEYEYEQLRLRLGDNIVNIVEDPGEEFKTK